MKPSQLAGFHRAVLGADELALRPLPWRQTRDPWMVLVSECMLQQTQARRVVGPYGAFVERFPTPAACARSPLADVLRAWSGLGYNRRAAQLHSAASVIVDRHGGSVPDRLEELVALPGIGPYTARAVLAFAFERRVGVVDVNVHRVLARAVSGAPLSRAQAQELADRLVPEDRAWRWNQSLLEHGAVLCTARAPRCGDCPLERRCAWASSGFPPPDPARRATRPSRFEGSERQGRGRLLAALCRGPVRTASLAGACGWPADGSRARCTAEALVSEGLARWAPDGSLALP